MSERERQHVMHHRLPLREQLRASLEGSLADHQRLMRALHPLDAPPLGDGWNRSELEDLLPPGPLVEAAVLAGIVPRATGAQVILTRRTEALRQHGGQVGFPGGRTEADDADAMAAALREDFGVPVKWIEPRSRDTFENASFSAALLRADGVRRILLVTDAMHMPRARAAFERAGMEVVSAPTLFFGGQARSPGAWVPSAEGMRRSWYAVYEWFGIAWYRLRYR